MDVHLNLCVLERSSTKSGFDWSVANCCDQSVPAIGSYEEFKGVKARGQMKRIASDILKSP